MKKVAIALCAFIHNHVDVNEGDTVIGLSDAALSDLEKNGLVRFDDQPVLQSAALAKSGKAAAKAAAKPGAKAQLDADPGKSAELLAVDPAKALSDLSDESSEAAADPAAGAQGE
ncbi:hypothetical protein [Undibacterium curvum]|uniref:hypothetical protein n=1 Tax=Undibacterium curvum TaxID=2762294 RepID=UPI003D0B2099